MPKFAANLTMLYNEHDFIERFAAAAADGFEAVEYLFPYAYKKELLADLLKEHDLTQALHNMPAGDWVGGERGIACLPGREEEFRAGVISAIEYATALGCKRVNCLAGIAPGRTRGRRAQDIRQNLRLAAPACAKAEIGLVVEPIKPATSPGSTSTAPPGAGLIDEVGSDNLSLQYDLYHQQRSEGDLVPNFQRHKDHINHIQIADNPGRNEPGTGEINYPTSSPSRRGRLRRVDRPPIQAQGQASSAGLGWFKPYRTRAA